MLSDRTIDEIACIVIKVLWGRFNSFPNEDIENTNAPFHEAFLKAFKNDLKQEVDIPYLINISSWLHGLKTTLGQVFFEEVSHILSNGYKYSFTQKQGNHLVITQQQQGIINDLIAGLKNNVIKPDLISEDKEIIKATSDTKFVDAPDFGSAPGHCIHSRVLC